MYTGTAVWLYPYIEKALTASRSVLFLCLMLDWIEGCCFCDYADVNIS